MASDKFRILLIASEAVPFAKVGGLADVVGALGKELQHRGQDVVISIPKYQCVYDVIEKNKIKIIRSADFTVSIENDEVTGKVEEIRYDGISYYLIDHPAYFKRNDIYNDSQTRTDFHDNLERFSFFCRASLESLKKFNFQPDIVHAHDWQTGLVPIYIKTLYKNEPHLKQVKTIFSIHNLSYQGIFPVEQFPITGLDWKYFTVNGLEYYGHINLMKGGVVFSDATTTVSETYAKEIQTPEYGNGLEGVMRDKAAIDHLQGIVNGVDYSEWDPRHDKFLKEKYKINYDVHSLHQKQKIKEAFLKEYVTQTPDLSQPVVSIISRLVDQKGFDLIFEIIEDILKTGAYFVVLGTGKIEYEKRLRQIQEKYPNRTAMFIRFDIPLSHYIEAASDIFLMPSRFEPCGLNQLYSLRYSALPVARKTGGIADTVKDERTGFLFQNYSPEDFLQSLKKAIQIYKTEPDRWNAMLENAFNEDWSWERAVKRYIDLFRILTEKSA